MHLHTTESRGGRARASRTTSYKEQKPHHSWVRAIFASRSHGTLLSLSGTFRPCRPHAAALVARARSARRRQTVSGRRVALRCAAPSTPEREPMPCYPMSRAVPATRGARGAPVPHGSRTGATPVPSSAPLVVVRLIRISSIPDPRRCLSHRRQPCGTPSCRALCSRTKNTVHCSRAGIFLHTPGVTSVEGRRIRSFRW